MPATRPIGSRPTAIKFRPLGLGYANLGSLLMASGLPYDSEKGRALAAAITAIMHGQAYLTSAEHAAHVGAFEGFAINREPMLRVMEMHRDAALAIDRSAPAELAGRGARRSGPSASSSVASTAIATARLPFWLRPAPSPS